MDSISNEEKTSVPPSSWSFSVYPVLNPLQKVKDEWFRADFDDLKPERGVVVNETIDKVVMLALEYNCVVIWPVESDEVKHEHLRAYMAEHKDKTSALRGELIYTTKDKPLMREQSPLEAVWNDQDSVCSFLCRRMPSDRPKPDLDKPVALVVVGSSRDMMQMYVGYGLGNFRKACPGTFIATVYKRVNE